MLISSGFGGTSVGFFGKTYHCFDFPGSRNVIFLKTDPEI